MGRPKPALGYASLTEAIIALRAEGQSERDIARALGKPLGTVSSLIHQHRQRTTVDPPARRFLIKPYVYLDLLGEAEKRSLSVADLIARLLTRIAADNLCAAVLDDG